VKWRVAWAIPLLLLVVGVRAAQNDAGAPSPFRERLESIREDLVDLRFEQALAALETVLADPALSEDERAETLILRSEVHVAFGDLDAAESDYRAILLVRPGYEPSSSLTPRKAMQRFEKVRATLIGRLILELEPPDARVLVDGRPVRPGPEGDLMLPAGAYDLRAEHEGFDVFDLEVEVVAGDEHTVRLELTPNARTVIVVTEQDDVEVLLDGTFVGRTRRSEDARPTSFARPPAELVLENVPLGDHVFELSKPCYRRHIIEGILTVDLLERTPRRFDVVSLVPSRSTLVIRGGPERADVRVDGESAGRTPVDAYEVCPGERRVEVRYGGRRIWDSVEDVRPSSQATIDIEPRPNAVLLGTDGWPAALAEFGEGFNTEVRSHRVGEELAEARGWRRVELPANTDLALAVLPAASEGAQDRWFLYSPILRVASEIGRAPLTGRPGWSTVTWGLSTADTRLGGPVLVVLVDESGPAARAGLKAGDRIVAAGGRTPRSTADLRAALEAAEGDARIEIEWTSIGGDGGRAVLEGARGPELATAAVPVERALVLAAWARVDGIAEPDRAAAAQANLAMLLSVHGQHERAVAAWRRVDWPDRRGVANGTAQYFLGAELEHLGREEEAVEAYRRAARSAATAYRDDGAPVAPAAEDRLADLGVSLSGD
jgi:tetratricopeptide (TPR) repeat protein